MRIQQKHIVRATFLGWTNPIGVRRWSEPFCQPDPEAVSPWDKSDAARPRCRFK
jgi:hypothetical protein